MSGLGMLNSCFASCFWPTTMHLCWLLLPTWWTDAFSTCRHAGAGTQCHPNPGKLGLQHREHPPSMSWSQCLNDSWLHANIKVTTTSENLADSWMKVLCFPSCPAGTAVCHCPLHTNPSARPGSSLHSEPWAPSTGITNYPRRLLRKWDLLV